MLKHNCYLPHNRFLFRNENSDENSIQKHTLRFADGHINILQTSRLKICYPSLTHWKKIQTESHTEMGRFSD